MKGRYSPPQPTREREVKKNLPPGDSYEGARRGGTRLLWRRRGLNMMAI